MVSKEYTEVSLSTIWLSDKEPGQRTNMHLSSIPAVSSVSVGIQELLPTPCRYI